MDPAAVLQFCSPEVLCSWLRHLQRLVQQPMQLELTLQLSPSCVIVTGVVVHSVASVAAGGGAGGGGDGGCSWGQREGMTP